MTLLNRIKVISFDATGTLFNVRGTVGSHYNKSLSKYGIKIDENKMNRNFLKCFSSLSKEKPSFGNDVNHRVETAEEWWKELVKMVMLKSVKESIDNPTKRQETIDIIENQIPPTFYNDLYVKFAGDRELLESGRSHECWELFPEVKETLDLLSKRDHKIITLISNFDERIYNILKHLGISSYFNRDLITTSFDCGYSKPHKAIFQDNYDKILKLDNTITKDQIVYIGDHIEKDLGGSSAFGYKSLLIDRYNQYPNVTNRITKLNDIFNIE